MQQSAARISARGATATRFDAKSFRRESWLSHCESRRRPSESTTTTMLVYVRGHEAMVTAVRPTERAVNSAALGTCWPGEGPNSDTQTVRAAVMCGPSALRPSESITISCAVSGGTAFNLCVSVRPLRPHATSISIITHTEHRSMVIPIVSGTLTSVLLQGITASGVLSCARP